MEAQATSRTLAIHVGRPLAKRPSLRSLDVLSRLGGVALVFLVLLALFGPLLPLGDPRAISVGPRFAAPGPHWLLGTDSLGRSLLPRVVEGLRYTLLFALAAVAVTVVLAILIGLSSAYRGGLLDAFVVRLADAGFAFPGLLLAILVSAVVGPGVTGSIIAVIVVTLPFMVRVVRGAALTIVERDFVAAAEVGGVSLPRIFLIHLLPNMAGQIIIQTTFLLSTAMLIESGLSFLGLGVQPPNASLGSLVSGGSLYLLIAPWLVFFPGGALAIAILSINLLGDGLRDLADPRPVRMLR